MLYLSPIFSIVLIYYMNKDFVSSAFDLFFLLLVLYFYKINFFFSIQMSSYFNYKINVINNFFEQNVLINKARLGLIIFMMINAVFSISIKSILDEVSFTYKYMIIFRVIYLFNFKGVIRAFQAN